MPPRRFPLMLVGFLGVATLLLGAVETSRVVVGPFSGHSETDTLPTDWEPIRFGDNASATAYDLFRAESTVVVRAQSENGASGLITHQPVDLQTHPILEWRWRVSGTVADGDITEKATDDAPARVYVLFEEADLGALARLKLMLLRSLGYDDLPARALNYVWANRVPRGHVRRSPYTQQIAMLPVRSGSADTERWVRERRNVRADYRRVFGEAPPPVAGVAIMTDTDNTGGTAHALYGDIVFRSATE